MKNEKDFSIACKIFAVAKKGNFIPTHVNPQAMLRAALMIIGQPGKDKK